MARKVISYKLNQDGSIPDYVDDGGYFPYNPNDTANAVIVGIAKDGFDISEAEAEFALEQDLLNYVSTYMSDFTSVEPSGEEKTFIVQDEVAKLFAIV